MLLRLQISSSVETLKFKSVFDGSEVTQNEFFPGLKKVRNHAIMLERPKKTKYQILPLQSKTWPFKIFEICQKVHVCSRFDKLLSKNFENGFYTVICKYRAKTQIYVQ